MNKPPAPTKRKNKRAIPHNAMHVLPNQSKNPKLGDAVMIGVGSNDEVTGLINFHSAKVIQVAPARHGDQKYRFKWQIPAGLDNNQQERVGWTNEHQRCAPNRKSKCDDRHDTHATFDFVRHIDIQELNKKELLTKLYQDLRGTALTTTAVKVAVTSPAAETATPAAEGEGEKKENEKEIENEKSNNVTCFVCNLQIQESKEVKRQYFHCCFQQYTVHASCDLPSFLLKQRSENKDSDVVKNKDGRIVNPCPMCDSDMPQTPLEKHECAIQMSLKVSTHYVVSPVLFFFLISFCLCALSFFLSPFSLFLSLSLFLSHSQSFQPTIQGKSFEHLGACDSLPEWNWYRLPGWKGSWHRRRQLSNGSDAAPKSIQR